MFILIKNQLQPLLLFNWSCKKVRELNERNDHIKEKLEEWMRIQLIEATTSKPMNKNNTSKKRDDNQKGNSSNTSQIGTSDSDFQSRAQGVDDVEDPNRKGVFKSMCKSDSRIKEKRSKLKDKPLNPIKEVAYKEVNENP